MGCSNSDAEKIADVFIAAELRGLPSHGMIRIKDYFQLWKANRINVKPDIRIIHETPSTAVVDGDRAVGMVAAARSMEIAIEKALRVGTGWVSTRNSNHYGIAGYYAMMALRHDMIGICMTNANPLVAPTFSISPMLGTNPIAVAIPAGNSRPLWLILRPLPLPGASLPYRKKKVKRYLLALFRIRKDSHPMIRPF